MIFPTSQETISDSQFPRSGATLRALSRSAWAWGSGAYYVSDLGSVKMHPRLGPFLRRLNRPAIVL
jgi:hypothetical protein